MGRARTSDRSSSPRCRRGSPWATRWLFGVMWHPMGILFAAGTPLIKVERLTRMPVIVSCSSDDAAERITRVLGLEANADTA
ncbi:hypothetical protein BN46_0849 [Corynebacterium otitidis ATCC 51513]|uniref:Uncharacterized protein n=2 Tax=Corynebacterium otitidis ATCC 51513 TaxID=883169 RepID=I7KJF2_9CORY|nr:hypothetical protein BN46_0849 [Corynebacterium otitidis ATCC 51513]